MVFDRVTRCPVPFRPPQEIDQAGQVSPMFAMRSTSTPPQRALQEMLGAAKTQVTPGTWTSGGCRQNLFQAAHTEAVAERTDTNPKRKRGSQHISSLTLRVSVRTDRVGSLRRHPVAAQINCLSAPRINPAADSPGERRPCSSGSRRESTDRH